MKRVRADGFYDLKRPAARRAALSEGAALCYESQKYTAATCLVACGIDALAGGKKKRYLRFLEDYFPDLCAGLGSRVFYEMYRNGIVHEFLFKQQYGIANNRETDGRYVEDFQVEGKEGMIRCINVDRLVKDYLALVARWEFDRDAPTNSGTGGSSTAPSR